MLFPKLVIFNQRMVIRLLLTPGFFTRRVSYYTVHVFITSLNKIKFIFHNTYKKKLTSNLSYTVLVCTIRIEIHYFFRCSCVAAYQHLAYYSSFWVVSRQTKNARLPLVKLSLCVRFGWFHKETNILNRGGCLKDLAYF